MKRALLLVLMVTLFRMGTGLAAEAVTTLSEFGFLIEQAKRGAGELFVVDVRDRESYLAATVPGAVHAGVTSDGYIGDGRGGPVLMVTESDASASFIQAWRDRLATFGHDPIYVLEGGFSSWVNRGGPIEAPTGMSSPPGTFPFVIPRGLCEMNTPVKVYP